MLLPIALQDAIKKAKEENITYLNPRKEGEEEWRKKIKDLNDKTLFPYSESWYMVAYQSAGAEFVCRLLETCRRECSG